MMTVAHIVSKQLCGFDIVEQIVWKAMSGLTWL